MPSRKPAFIIAGIELPRAPAIIQRVEPRHASAPRHVFELPAPERPDLQYVASTGLLRTLLPGFGAECASALGLDASRARELATRIEALLATDDGEEPARLAAFEHPGVSITSPAPGASRSRTAGTAGQQQRLLGGTEKPAAVC